MSSSFELAHLIPCGKCDAPADQPCTTISGRTATWPHSARLNPVNDIWIDGFEDGVREGIEAPELHRAWIERGKRVGLL